MEAILGFLGIALFISWIVGNFQEDKIDLNKELESLENQLKEKDKEIEQLCKRIEHLQTLVKNYRNRDGKSFDELIKEYGSTNPIKGFGNLGNEGKTSSKTQQRQARETYDWWREQD